MKDGWITDRMPEERDSIYTKLYGTEKWADWMCLKMSDKVLVTINDRGVAITEIAATRDGGWTSDYLLCNKDAKIIAWMPYPEPYKEVKADGKYSVITGEETQLCPRCGTIYETDYDDYDCCPNCGLRIDYN